MQCSWVVLLSSISWRILFLCFSHRRGLSGWPWIACLTGRTYPLGMGGRFKCYVHHLWYWSSMDMKMGSSGGSASGNAFPVSASITVIPLSAARDQNIRDAGCSTQLAYVWAIVTARPYRFHHSEYHGLLVWFHPWIGRSTQRGVWLDVWGFHLCPF